MFYHPSTSNHANTGNLQSLQPLQLPQNYQQQQQQQQQQQPQYSNLMTHSNLLSHHQLTSSHPHSAHHTVTDEILNFEKIFFGIYQYYTNELSLHIDLTQNMLSLCLDHLIPFSCWARRDPLKSEWLHKLLLENADLRPEVRNGIALVIIYVFASAKEHLESENIDMFGVLQDTHYGLGIVHKTSLRIYNDPLNYFGFLKCCVTGLIYAHAIPENERQNKPKSKSRQVEQVTNEVDAYLRMKEIVRILLNEHHHNQAQDYIRQILLFWQINKHKVRDCWFSAALASVKPPNLPSQALSSSMNYGSFTSQGMPPMQNHPSSNHLQQMARSSSPSQGYFGQQQQSSQTIPNPQQNQPKDPSDAFWDIDSTALDIGFGLEETPAVEIPGPSPRLSIHTSANSSDLSGMLTKETEKHYFEAIPTSYQTTNTPGTVSTAPSSNRSSPASSVGGRTKFSRDNSSDCFEITPSFQGRLTYRDRYRDNHFPNDYSDHEHHNEVENDHHNNHDSHQIQNHTHTHNPNHAHNHHNKSDDTYQPTKIQRVEHQLYHKSSYDNSLDDDHRDTENESSHDCGNSDNGSVNGNYTQSNIQPGLPIARSVSNCSILSDVYITHETQPVPIQHSLSCNSILGSTTMKSSHSSSSLHQMGHHHPPAVSSFSHLLSHGSGHISGNLNSYHVGGNNGHSNLMQHQQSNQFYHRALLNYQESKHAIKSHHPQYDQHHQQQHQQQHQQHHHHQLQHHHHQLQHQHSGDQFLPPRHPLNQHLSPASISSTHGSTRSTIMGFHQPLQLLRYTKISNQIWFIHIDKVYQIESFLNKLSSSTMYLIDEKMIPTQEWMNQKLESLGHGHMSNGVTDIEMELEQRKMLITSWPPQLHEQLVGFIQNWHLLLSQYEEQKRLHEERLSPCSPSSIRGETTSATTHGDPPTLLSLWSAGPISLPSRSSLSSSCSSSGVLAYEVSLQHGVIIRADPITEENEMWSLVYLHDILHPTPDSDLSLVPLTCYDFFCRIFPQFSSFINHLSHGRGDLHQIGIKYCSHSFKDTSSSSSSFQNYDDLPSSPIRQEQHLPPSNPLPSAYQTLGLLSDPASKIIGRFQGEFPLFHDILIFTTY